MRVTERQQAIPRDHRHHGVCAATTAMHGRDRREDGFGIEAEVCGIGLQFVRQDVEQHFRIGTGVHMAHVLEEQFFLQLRRIGEIAVVPQHQTERRIHIERLRFVVINGGTSGRIAHMGDTRIAGKRAHVAGAKHVVRQTIALVQMKSIALQRCNARGILTAMLQHLQTVIQQLIDGGLRYDAENATHDSFLNDPVIITSLNFPAYDSP